MCRENSKEYTEKVFRVNKGNSKSLDSGSIQKYQFGFYLTVTHDEKWWSIICDCIKTLNI